MIVRCVRFPSLYYIATKAGTVNRYTDSIIVSFVKCGLHVVVIVRDEGGTKAFGAAS